MDTNNPYQTPKSDLLTRDTANEETLKIAKGQKKVIYAILVNILAYILQIYIGQIAALVNLFAIGLSTAGLIQMSKGMKYSTTAIILLVLLFFIPVINLLVLLRINGKATSYLQKRGYTVGLLGAKM
ncbi:hypothetical protein [Desulfogranum japonicum]|uniref:hypothetical protein n=1 Tax=Desulfogranum japonicum TaxID=231447 RepID=UPI000490460E|nr:hypothetical protein [Desulfogranum japonicum]